MKRSQRQPRTSRSRVRTAEKELSRQAPLQKVARWVGQHPRTVISGALVVALALLLAQSPAEPVAYDAYNGETPLFV